MILTPQQAVQIDEVTGPNTQQYGMGAADLGVMWQSGSTTFHAFGDNFKTLTGHDSTDGGPIGSDWRPNALGRSSELDFRHGIVFDNFNVDGAGNRTAPLPINPVTDDGTVPTAGIHVGRYDVMAYATFKLGHTDQVQTRVGGTAYSVDSGRTWYKSVAYWENNSTFSDPFQQSAFAYDGGNYIYRFTTEASRGGNIHLLRCPASPDSSVITKSAYQYWTGSGWSTNPADVKVLIPGPVGEMSARFDDLLGQWMIMYHDDPGNQTVFRYAPAPTGPWSAALPILDDSVATIYAPEIHPQSSGTGLWFCGSVWSTYQTYLFYSNINVWC